jgi:hypothetical protein
VLMLEAATQCKRNTNYAGNRCSAWGLTISASAVVNRQFSRSTDYQSGVTVLVFASYSCQLHSAA